MRSRGRALPRPGRVLAGLVVLSVLLWGSAACGHAAKQAVGCVAGDPRGQVVSMDLEQASDAATIAAVARRLGLPDHAVTIALATAMQESKLHNLEYGDRDSLGLFQQRPSQGWGSADRILVPRLAVTDFYRHLLRVRGWQQLPVATAAQAVQHSGYPSAYAQWEDSARLLARAFTGEVPAGIRCTLGSHRSTPDLARVQELAALELGTQGLHPSTPTDRWRAAAWLVAHASALHLQRVSAQARVWTARSGGWSASPDPDPQLRWS